VFWFTVTVQFLEPSGRARSSLHKSKYPKQYASQAIRTALNRHKFHDITSITVKKEKA